MTKFRIKILFIVILFTSMSLNTLSSDGGYFTKASSIAESADQRAIIIKNGSEISMTFSTGYTGEGDDFGWIIPCPVPPDVKDVFESGEDGEAAFQFLNELTSPSISARPRRRGGCFPAGTEVLTDDGPRAIESVRAGAKVLSFDFNLNEWVLKHVLKRHSIHFAGDMITIQAGGDVLRATGNHPFYVLKGEELASRPQPVDVPAEEFSTTGTGRWVEARALVKGDVLLTLNSGSLKVTGLTCKEENTEVYNLMVEDNHNYAVNREGFLVHNKGQYEDAGQEKNPVKVYGTVTLENYEVSIVGAEESSALFSWLERHDYMVEHSAGRIFDAYIEQNWAFAAVKMTPGAKRHYENEFLPPLTIRCRSDRLVFPLRISSVSTMKDVKITLYVITENPVSASNYPTDDLKYEREHYEWIVPDKYIETCIRETLSAQNGGLVAMYRDQIYSYSFNRSNFGILMDSPYPEAVIPYLTRFESRMEPGEMIEDIQFEDNLQLEDFDVYIWSDEGFGPELVGAAWNGETETVRSLLEAGEDADTKDFEGGTALVEAASRGHADIIRLLLEAGADPDVQVGHHWSPLMLASRAGHTDAVKALLDAEVDVNLEIRNNSGTAIILAAREGHADIVKLLADAGSDVPADAMISAAGAGNEKIVQILLDAGADVDAANINGWTALMSASYNGQEKIVRILLEAGADITAVNKKGRTALGLAKEQGHAAIVRILGEL